MSFIFQKKNSTVTLLPSYFFNFHIWFQLWPGMPHCAQDHLFKLPWAWYIDSYPGTVGSSMDGWMEGWIDGSINQSYFINPKVNSRTYYTIMANLTSTPFPPRKFWSYFRTGTHFRISSLFSGSQRTEWFHGGTNKNAGLEQRPTYISD